MKEKLRNNKTKIAIIVLSIQLVSSIGLNIYAYAGTDHEEAPLFWLQSEEFVEETINGVLKNSKDFRDGEKIVFEYDFDNKEYATLLEKYHLKETAGEGSEFAKAKNLMHEYAGRIRHDGNAKVLPENMNAEYLLAAYLDNKKEGTYCRAKAQILNEMCLSLGIYARKLWIESLSVYENECHVVNEVWDSEYEKWIMLDISNDLYWVDENATPLSVLEIRDMIINNEFCTPVISDDDLKDLQKSREAYEYYYAYYVKNLAVLEYMDRYTVGETQGFWLMPVNYTSEEDEIRLISRDSVEASPIK